MDLKYISEKGYIGNIELRNRLIWAPIAPRASRTDGVLTKEAIDYYVERAKGEVGLINIGHTFCWYEEKTGGNTGLWSQEQVEVYKIMNKQIHDLGSKVIPQLGGRGTKRADGKSIAPSSFQVGFEKEKPRELTIEEIKFFIDHYGTGAALAREGGFDGVEIHAAHGKLISLFLSAYSNRRNDEYGGDLERRAAFLLNIIDNIQKKAGKDFPIIVRYSADDMLEGGNTLTDGIEIAKLLEKAGVSALHISGGNQEKGWNTSFSYFYPPKCLVEDANEVKKHVDIPIIAVGKIGDVFQGEKILAEGKADFIALGRPLVTDAHHFVKAKEGKIIRRCINCLNCFTFANRRERIPLGITCTVNPELFRENSFSLDKVEAPKKVLVVGGGLAGMQISATLAMRGHNVELHEQESELGGQWRVASKSEYKNDFRSIITYLSHLMKEHKVEVKLSSKISKEDLKNYDYDALVIATGAVPRVLKADGQESTNVEIVQAMDCLMGKEVKGKRVVVLGGRYIGMETAIKLAKEGKHVSLVEAFELGHGTESRLKGMYRNKLVENGVFIFDNSPLLRFVTDGVDIAHKGSMLTLPCDTLVTAIGTVSNNEFGSNETLPHETYVIGDANKIGDALYSIRDGAEIGRII